MNRPIIGTTKQPTAHTPSASSSTVHPCHTAVKKAHLSESTSRTANISAKHPTKPETCTKGKSTVRETFIKKLQICMNMYNYACETADAKGKAEKLAAINYLKTMLDDKGNVAEYVMPNLEMFMDMITRNIFRPLPNVRNCNHISISETGIQLAESVDPSWPHLQGIYELFILFLANDATGYTNMKAFLTPQFIQGFFGLFDSGEPKERDYLKCILHKSYAKFVPRRKIFRKAIADFFLALIHENHKFNGTAELLDIMAGIISGFAVPLREEHVIFFKCIIVPLYKVQTSELFFDQLLKCSMFYLNKDKALAIPLLQGILKYWPFANYRKETLYLTGLQEIMEIAETEKLRSLVPRLFKRVVRCIAGSHLQVADRAMCLFEDGHFISILKAYKEIIFPILAPVVVKLADTHWHNTMRESLIALKVILKETDLAAFDQALGQGQMRGNELRTEQDPEERKRLDDKWAKLTTEVKKKNPGFEEPDIPFAGKHAVGEYNELYAKISDKEKYINLQTSILRINDSE